MKRDWNLKVTHLKGDPQVHIKKHCTWLLKSFIVSCSFVRANKQAQITDSNTLGALSVFHRVYICK